MRQKRHCPAQTSHFNFCRDVLLSLILIWDKWNELKLALYCCVCYLVNICQFVSHLSSLPNCVCVTVFNRTDKPLIWLLFAVSQVWVRWAGKECVSRLWQRQRRPRGAQAGLCWRADRRCPPQEVSSKLGVAPNSFKCTEQNSEYSGIFSDLLATCKICFFKCLKHW